MGSLSEIFVKNEILIACEQLVRGREVSCVVEFEI